MWDAGESMEEIAAALGCSLAAVKNQRQRHDWPRRPHGGQPRRKPGRRTPPGHGLLPGRGKIALTKCPACKAMTTLQPCEMCHKKIPASAIGKV